MWAPAFRQAIRIASPTIATLAALASWNALDGKDSPIHCEEHSFEGTGRKHHPVGVGHFPKHHVPNPRLWVHDALSGDGSLFKGAVGVEASKALHQMSNMLIFSGSSNPSLAEEIAYELHKPLGKISLGRYADGETTVQVLENVRGKDVFIVQSTCQPVHENLMELLLMISTMRRASARTITAVIPYYGYKRDVGTAPSFVTMIRSDAPTDSMDIETVAAGRAEFGTNETAGALPASGSLGRAITGLQPRLLPAQDFSFPVSAADVAKMLEAMGVDRIIAVELQPPGNGQIEGFFTSSVPVENVRATALAVEHFRKLKLNNVVVVSPNETCIPLAQDFRSGLQKTTGKPVGFATIIEAGRSRGADRYVHNMRSSSDEATLDVVGDVAGMLPSCHATIVRIMQHQPACRARRHYCGRHDRHRIHTYAPASKITRERSWAHDCIRNSRPL
jgi:phosphoribosylpyrophosphate synthetase